MSWSCNGHRQHLLHLATPVTRPDSVWFRQAQCLRPTTSKDTTRIAESTSTAQLGTSHKTCLRGFGGNWSIAWTSAVSHAGRTSNAFKVTMKLHTFLFQMVVTPCIYVQYLWKCGFAKSSDNLYASCIINLSLHLPLPLHVLKWRCTTSFTINLITKAHTRPPHTSALLSGYLWYCVMSTTRGFRKPVFIPFTCDI